jgi:hypothetical protein
MTLEASELPRNRPCLEFRAATAIGHNFQSRPESGNRARLLSMQNQIGANLPPRPSIRQAAEFRVGPRLIRLDRDDVLDIGGVA